ncbi:MAG TPA: putative toxin-antitoxin system toxin component, PIN family [Stellaceae bacterium]|jgi:putative PIN family toxin of toxin-antitoxin system|nr:putative toxin-antitoxin system toxin component, PIN family [Stellaceae bacterium]
MRLVFDTNVFVSAALKDGSTPAAAVRIAESEHTLLKSTETERQLFDVLARPRFAPLIPEAAARRFASLIARAEIVTINERISVCRDPTDDKFLELAVNGSADLIVSGDSDLLILDPFREIGIVTPAQFVRLITSRR